MTTAINPLLREKLARVQDHIRIEDLFDASLNPNAFGREFHGYELLFGFADAVLARDGPLHFQCQSENFLDALLDTIDLLRNGMVHPLARGSNSLKAVLPALCPELRYEPFADGRAAHGDNAAALWHEWHLGELTGDPDRIAALRRSLLAYCELDTRGMYEVIRAVVKLTRDPAQFEQWEA